MRRTGRRHSIDYLEENEEIQQPFENYETFDTTAEVDYTTEESEMVQDFDDSETSSSARVWITIAKVVLVILLLIGLFFASMKLTQVWIGRNQEPEAYGDESDVPVYEDTTSDEPADTSVEDDEDADDDEEADNDDTSSSDSSIPTEKPAEKPSTPSTPEEKPAEKPATPSTPEEKPAENPSTPTTPSEPSKPSAPSITPGNPAA